MARELTDICGYIFMQKSPSCGLERVKVRISAYRDRPFRYIVTDHFANA